MLKFKTLKDEIIYVNKEHIVSIRCGSKYHVSLIDFGFDISKEEFDRIKIELGLE